MFSFIRHSRAWFALSGVTTVIALIALGVFGLNLGLDFTGGTLLEAQFAQPTTPAAITQAFTKIEGINVGTPAVTPTDTEGRYLIRFRYLENEAEQQAVESTLRAQVGSFTTERLTTVGPTLGESLREKSVRALTYTSIAIILYLAITFRDARREGSTKYWLVGGALAMLAIVTEMMIEAKLTQWLVFGATVISFVAFLIYEITRKNPSLKYGVVAVVALLHDVIIMIGVFAALGVFLGVEIDALFVTAVLTVMGFSVHDTIVVFDRVRENLKRAKGESFAQTADISLNQTLARSINTSMTTLITLGALYALGAESIQWFVLALIVGIVIGTYSSIFIATPLLVVWQRKISEA